MKKNHRPYCLGVYKAMFFFSMVAMQSFLFNEQFIELKLPFLLCTAVDGVLTMWSEFYSCDVTCGGGIQWRNRTCEGPYYGGANCTESLEESRDCNMHNCPSMYMYCMFLNTK